MKNILIAFILLLLASCTSRWTDEEKTAFHQNCVISAQNAADAYPNETCDCLTQKLEKEFPNPTDMADLLDSLRLNPILLFDRYPDCRTRANDTPVKWTPVAEKAFLKSCDTLVKKGEVANTSICPCILDKVKKRFPTVQRMQHLNTAVMHALSEECEGKRPASLY